MGRSAIPLVVLVALAIGGVTPTAAEALCVCGDFDGCSSAIACEGASPGDACSPPRQATCKIVKGNGNGVSCCCGCTRGPGPIGCVFSPVVEQLAQLEVLVCESEAAASAGAVKGACTCIDKKLYRRTHKTVTKAGKLLVKAETACGKQKDPRKKVTGARKRLSSLDKIVDRAVQKQKVTAECGTALKGLITELGVQIDTAENGGGTGDTTTTTTPSAGTTTTSTMPAADVTCTGQLSVPVGFPLERNFGFSCTGPGSHTFTGFALKIESGYQFVNQIDPPGFTCNIQQLQEPGDWFWCTGSFGLGDAITGGRVAISPAPPSDLSLGLSVQNQGTFGPFDLGTQ